MTLTPPKGRYTALGLEALPTKGKDGRMAVGRNPADPNFVVSELILERLDGDSVRRIGLRNARADFSQDGWPVASAIDGVAKTGWAVSPRSRELPSRDFRSRRAVGAGGRHEATGDDHPGVWQFPDPRTLPIDPERRGSREPGADDRLARVPEAAG